MENHQEVSASAENGNSLDGEQKIKEKQLRRCLANPQQNTKLPKTPQKKFEINNAQLLLYRGSDEDSLISDYKKHADLFSGVNIF